MKGSRTAMAIGDESIEWIEQHHRNTSHKSLHHQHSFGLDASGDESDSTERHNQSHFYSPDPHMQTKESHIEQAVQAIQVLKAASKPAGWKKLLKHKSGCLVYQSSGHSDKHPTYKGEHVIRGYRAQEVFSVVGVRKLWDDWYDELRLVESYDDATNLMYMVMKGTLSSKTRDISMVERIEVERDGTIYFASCSVESSKLPRISGKVRADIFVAGWIIQPLPSNPPITKITYVIQTDLLSRLPKFIARRALAKRPLVITTIETHLRKNGVPMVMSKLVSQTTAHRHRSLSEPLKPEKFLDAESEADEKIQSGSAFLSPIGPITSDTDMERVSKDDDSGDEDIQLALTSASENATASRESLAPSLVSSRSTATSNLAPEFLEKNARLGISESSIRHQDERTSNDEPRSHSPAPSYTQISDRARPPLAQSSRALFSERDSRHRHSGSGQQRSEAQSSRVLSNANPSAERPNLPQVVTPATPPLTPTTSIDGKDTTSDSEASTSTLVMVVPRSPKHNASLDSILPARPSSMAFAAHGILAPSDMMDARHSTLVSRSSSFAPRHSHILPFRGNSNASLQNLHRMSSAGTLSNAMKRMSTATSLDSSRSSTLLSPTITLPHRHSEKARKALAMFKVLAASPEDRWRPGPSDGVFKHYSRVISGAGLPMLRGEGVISGGWTVEQINAAIETAGCRQIWDERFENLSIAETFNSNEYLFHITLRGIGSLTGRDLAGVTIIDRDPQTSALYNVSTSVLDNTIPEDPSRVRAILELSGWSLRPIFDGRGNTISVNITYVIQLDIRGSLPNSVLKSVSASMMTVVPRLNDFINDIGHPPYAHHIAGSRLFDTFNPETGHYELCYKAAPGWTEVRVGRKVYRDGYDFFIKPDDPTVRVELAPDFGGVRVFTTLDHEGQSIIAQVTRKGTAGVVATNQPAQQQQDEDGGDDGDDDCDDNDDKTNRRSPRRTRNTSFDATSPTYGGPSLRKSSSHLKSNDQNQNAEQVVDGSSADAGGGSDLRPSRTPSSLTRKRRSASYTTLSAFDPNLIVASSSSFSSERLDEPSQASAAPRASQESEKSQSRGRTSRRLVDLPAGTTSPLFPPRSSSLGRRPALTDSFLNQANAPPLPINPALMSPTLGHDSPAPSPTPSTSSSIFSDIPSPISTTAPTSIATMIHSPMFSPTLGPLRIPQVTGPSKTNSHADKASPLLKESDTSSVLTDIITTTTTILQPAAEIQSSSSPSEQRPEASKLSPSHITSPSSPNTNSLSPKDLENKMKEEEKEEGKSKEEEPKVISLAAMNSPLASPLPTTVKLSNFLEPVTPVSRLKHSSSSASLNGGVRRVTFAPDVIDNSESRSSISRSRKPKKKKSISSSSSPLTELQNSLKIDSPSQGTKSIPVSTVARVASFGAVAVQGEEDYESDEAEFVEALSEFVVEISEAKKSKSTLEIDHAQDYEQVWQNAIQLFIKELNSAWVMAAVIFLVLVVYDRKVVL